LISFYFLNSGETTANRGRIVQGHKDYKLNENGMEQARRASAALVDVPFDDVYVSDLSRAYDTATTIVMVGTWLITSAVSFLCQLY